MTREQAQQALKDGKEITHWLFAPSESIHMEGGVIHDEAGLILHDFWEYRKGKNFDSGWSIVE